eukprot:m.874700 g.874700  ORF g.874700 m.874700 type:complete len:515 (-) comp23577_c0_seq4:143-1687(-)
MPQKPLANGRQRRQKYEIRSKEHTSRIFATHQKIGRNNRRSALGFMATCHSCFWSKQSILYCITGLTMYLYLFNPRMGTNDTDVELTTGEVSPVPPTIGGLSVVRVGRRRWMPRTNVTELLGATTAVPVVLTQSPAELWPARLWTPQYLTRSGVVFPKVYTSHDPHFRYYDATKPMASAAAEAALRNVSANEPAQRFFRRLDPVPDDAPAPEHPGAEPTFAYLSADLQEYGMRALLRDVRPLSPFAPTAAKQVFLWAGTAGSTAPFHYDTSHNCYVQLYGRKRFFLLPPSQHAKMYVNPVSHPSDRQSQVEWHPSPEWVLNRTKHPEFDDVDTVHVVDLAPGELLLLPALWFHRVEALSPSISVNVWTLSAAAQMFEDEVLANAIPFYSSAWPPDQVLVLCQSYLPRVLSAVLGGPDAADDFVEEILHQQYQHNGALYNLAANYPCSTSRGKNLEESLAHPVQRTAVLFRNMPQVEQRVYLAVWLEHISDFAVGARDTPAFLQRCVCRRCHSTT